MRDAFGYVLFAVVAVGIICAAVGLTMSGNAYKEIGKGGFFKDTDGPRPPASGAISDAERDDEIRQMLTARNARHAASGREVVDVEEELARLVAAPSASADPALRAEVRELVVARNRRLERQGKPTLDVDAEVERQLRDLGAS